MSARAAGGAAITGPRAGAPPPWVHEAAAGLYARLYEGRAGRGSRPAGERPKRRSGVAMARPNPGVSAGVARVLAGEARWVIEPGDGFALLAGLPDRAVDHVITDPPYDQRTSRNARSVVGAMRKDNGSRNERLLRRRLVPFDGTDPASVAAAILRLARRWSLTFCALEQLGAYASAGGPAWVRAGIWHRLGGAPQFSGDRPAQGAEGLAILHRPGRKRWGGGGDAAFWECARVPSGRSERVHPTQKPIELMMRLVALFTDPGDVVLDPFCGSGTTGVACVRQGRRFIGIELHPRWVALARRRLRADEQGSTLAASLAGQQPLFDLLALARGGAPCASPR